MRQCIICDTKIEACMGFVLARDLVDKRIPIREICGKCGMMFLEMDETQLEGCLSGLKERFAKSSGVTAPWVRIPSLLPNKIKGQRKFTR